MTPHEALRLAVEKCGSEAELARRIGVTGQAINQWKVAPPLRVLDIERASGVSRHLLRPDLYPIESSEKRKAIAAGAHP